MSKRFSLFFTSLVILLSNYSCATNTTLNNPLLNDDLSQSLSTPKKETPITRVIMDNPPFINQGSELSGLAVMADGKIVKYQTIKNAGSTATATTIVYQSKWVKIESHPTTSNEAETILKLVGQGGFSKEYKTLKDRYTEAGLIDSKGK